MEFANLKRWEALDYLRGLMALSILVFHFDKWTSGHWDASTVQGKLGVYAVSIFFVLSGMALMVTYQQKMTAQWRSVALYAKKRVFRIFPVLWIASAATLLLQETPRGMADILLNFSGLFGFVDASRDIATGAWSIGCELTYYALFPVLLFLTRARKWAILIATAMLAYVGFREIYSWPFWPYGEPQAVWWPHYVQAQQHAFFFTAGMALVVYRSSLDTWPRYVWRILLCVSMIAFIWSPVSENPQVLVGGSTRVLLSFITILATTAWSFGLGSLHGIPRKVLTWLGAISYSLYLLHPLVFRATKAVLTRWNLFPELLLLPLAFIGTLVASHIIYNFIEKPAMKKARMPPPVNQFHN